MSQSDPNGGLSSARNIERVEDRVENVRDRTIRCEAKIESLETHMATKADLANTKWALAASLLSLVIAILVAFSRFSM